MADARYVGLKCQCVEEILIEWVRSFIIVSIILFYLFINIGGDVLCIGIEMGVKVYCGIEQEIIE